MTRSKTLIGVIAGAAALLIATGASTISTVSAAPPSPAEDPAPIPTVTTLPLFGAQLTVEVATGPGGALSSVSVNPADSFTATTLKPNRVVFVNADGTAKVSVGSKHGGQKVEARAGSLAEVTGAGGWSGDVFGTGVATTVEFTVGPAADGGPDITGVGTSDPSAVIGPTEYKTDDEHEGELEQKASVKITFTNGGQSRVLSIKVEVETHDDGDTHAKVKVSLGRLRGVAQPVADATGTKVWNGLLCDGTPASVTYTVNEDGTLTFGSASPEPERVKNEGGKIDVRFDKDARVKIKARLGDEGITVQVDEKIRCRDAEDPVVNTPTSTVNEDGHDGHHDGDRDGHHEDDHDDDHDGQHDDRQDGGRDGGDRDGGGDHHRG